MATIYLIRHGQASFGAHDYDSLSELGQEQSKLVGQALKQKLARPGYVIGGDMLRHKQTLATAMEAGENSFAAEFDPGWNEYDHQAILGALDHRLATPATMRPYLMEFDDPKRAFADLFEQAIRRWIQGDNNSDYPESWTAFSARVEQALSNLSGRMGSAETAFVFTSGGPISWILCKLMGMDPSRFLQLNWTLVNTGITKIVISRQRCFVSCMNEHVHLEATGRKDLITYK